MRDVTNFHICIQKKCKELNKENISIFFNNIIFECKFYLNEVLKLSLLLFFFSITTILQTDDRKKITKDEVSFNWFKFINLFKRVYILEEEDEYIQSYYMQQQQQQ